MNAYIVWPLRQEPLKLYTTVAFELLPGFSLFASCPEEAAKAALVRRPGGGKRFDVLGPEGLTRVDLEPPEGFETLDEEGLYRR